MTKITRTVTDDGIVEFRDELARLHNTEGAAQILPDGSQFWCFENKYHRWNGPAIDKSDGTKMWFIHGKRHRAGAPAVEHADGRVEYWEHGHQVENI